MRHPPKGPSLMTELERFSSLLVAMSLSLPVAHIHLISDYVDLENAAQLIIDRFDA